MQQTFYPGTKWLYFKIYCGQSFANSLLVNHIYELVQEFTTQGKIRKWFFIRFEDPNFHIRLRLEVTDIKNTGSIFEKINRKLRKEISNGKVWKVQIEPYQREIQRYGKNNMESVEEMFWEDSIFVCQALNILSVNENSMLLISMANLDNTFSTIAKTIEDKRDWAKLIHRSLQQEFDIFKRHKKKLNSYYINSILTRFDQFTERKEVKILLDEKFENHWKKITLLKGNDTIIRNILYGLNHMHCNRLFSNRQRLYEMISYDFLILYYNSIIYKTFKI